MNEITLNISGYRLQCRFPALDCLTKRRIAGIFAPFADESDPVPQSRLTILPVAMDAWTQPNQELKKKIKNFIKTYLLKFPFTVDAESELNLLFNRIEPFLNDPEFVRHLQHTDRDDPVSILAIDRSCLMQNHAAGSAFLFLKTSSRWIRSFWDRSCAATVTKAVYFVAATSLPLANAMMLHGTGIERQKTGILFLGSSGAGKTTIARFCGAEDVLGDDAVLLKQKNGQYFIGSSPFNAGIASPPKESKLAMVLLIEKDTYHGLEAVSPAAAGSIILKNHIHFFRNFSPEAVTKTFHQVADLCRHIPVFTMHFKKDSSFLEMIDQQLTASRGLIEQGGQP